MPDVIKHLYKYSPSQGGLLYAWFPSMHTRVDIMLCGRQGEDILLSVVDAVYGETLGKSQRNGDLFGRTIHGVDIGEVHDSRLIA